MNFVMPYWKIDMYIESLWNLCECEMLDDDDDDDDKKICLRKQTFLKHWRALAIFFLFIFIFLE